MIVLASLNKQSVLSTTSQIYDKLEGEQNSKNVMFLEISVLQRMKWDILYKEALVRLEVVNKKSTKSTCWTISSWLESRKLQFIFSV